MASDLLIFLLQANLALAAAVLLVLVLRRPVRAMFGAHSAYGLWLIVPFSILALLIPARTIVVPQETVRAAPMAPAPVQIDQSAPRTAPQARIPDLPLAQIALGLWGLVALAAVILQAERQRRFVRSLGRLKAVDGLLWSNRPGVGPAVIGALAPRVVLPADFAQRFTPQEQTLILAHEYNHLIAGDAKINAAVTGLQCLFWFNPLIHLGAAALRVDQEIACDAAVVARHPNTRRAYGEAMLKTQLAACAPPLGCHWPPSANQQLKERFTMLSRHHSSRGRHLAGAVAVAVLALSTGVTAWATQPPRTVQASRFDTPEARQLGLQLFNAVQARDLTQVKALLAQGANPNHILRGDGSPLIQAARHGQLDMVQTLLAAGADPNLPVRGDGAPLIQASLSGNLAVVRLLVEHGADIEIYVPRDETPLINAAQAGRLDIVRYLVERGADVNREVVANPGEMRSPLGQARDNGHPDVVNYLKSRGARG